MFPEQHLVTVWSAPNYCYRCGNVASILIFDDSLQRDVRYFTETAENSTMMAPRVRCGWMQGWRGVWGLTSRQSMVVEGQSAARVRYNSAGQHTHACGWVRV
jgi:hypothetical protein